MKQVFIQLADPKNLHLFVHATPYEPKEINPALGTVVFELETTEQVNHLHQELAKANFGNWTK